MPSIMPLTVVRLPAARVASSNNHTTPHKRQSDRCRERLPSSTPSSTIAIATPVPSSHNSHSAVPSYTPPAPTATAGSDSGGPSYMSGVQTDGEGTWYAVSLGACGNMNYPTQFVVAVSFLLFNHYPGYSGSNPNHNPVCGRRVGISYNGAYEEAEVVDVCEGCTILTSLDMSTSLFQKFAPLGTGRIYNLTWSWLP